MLVDSSESNRAALKLVGSVTVSTLILSSGIRIACGSGLHSVNRPGSKFAQTEASVKEFVSTSVLRPGIRFKYGSGGMFMIDMVGFFDLATASSSSRTPAERYC